MGFSEFQQRTLSRNLSSVFLSDDSDSDDEPTQYAAAFNPRAMWKAGTKKVMLYNKFLYVVRDSVVRNQWIHFARRKLRAMLDRIILAPVEVYYITSVLQHTDGVQPVSLSLSFFTRTIMFTTIIPCAVGKGLVDIDEAVGSRQVPLYRTLIWLVIKGVWQQPFNNTLVRTITNPSDTTADNTLFNIFTRTAKDSSTLLFNTRILDGAFLGVAREFLEFGLARFFSSRFWKLEEEDNVSTIWKVGRMSFRFCCQYFLPAGLCIVNLNVQKLQTMSYLDVTESLYNKHGLLGFTANAKTSITTIISSLVVYNCVHLFVSALLPHRENYTKEVEQTKSGLIRSQGQVVTLTSTGELSAFVSQQPVSVVLLCSDSSPELSYESRRLKKYNKKLAKDYVKRAVFAQMNVDLVDEIESTKTTVVWVPFFKGQPSNRPTADLGNVKSQVNKMLKDLKQR